MELPRGRDELKRHHNRLQEQIKTDLKQFDQRQILYKLTEFRNTGAALLAAGNGPLAEDSAEASCQRHFILKELEALLEEEDVQFDGNLALELQRAMADNFGDSNPANASGRGCKVELSKLQDLADRWCTLALSEDFPEQCERFERAIKRSFKQLKSE